MSGGNMTHHDRFRHQDPDRQYDQYDQDDDSATPDEPSAQHDPGRYRWQDEATHGEGIGASRREDDFGSFEEESGSDDATW